MGKKQLRSRIAYLESELASKNHALQACYRDLQDNIDLISKHQGLLNAVANEETKAVLVLRGNNIAGVRMFITHDGSSIPVKNLAGVQLNYNVDSMKSFPPKFFFGGVQNFDRFLADSKLWRLGFTVYAASEPEPVQSSSPGSEPTP